MITEIELKAWVYDPEEVKARLMKLGTYLGSYTKDDEYWRDSAGQRELGSGVRIRRLSGSVAGERPRALVTFKRKEVREGVEINDEEEFEVSDVDTFAALLTRLGLSPWIRKRKVGEAWNLGGITAELSLLVGLGTFVELELLSEEADPGTIARSRTRLMEALSTLGVPEERIETRYYTELLTAPPPPR